MPSARVTVTRRSESIRNGTRLIPDGRNTHERFDICRGCYNHHDAVRHVHDCTCFCLCRHETDILVHLLQRNADRFRCGCNLYDSDRKEIIMQFEVVLYSKDDDGKKKQISRYNIEQFDLSREIDRLNQDVKDGVIADFDIAMV